MAASDYHFVTRWEIAEPEATPALVCEILADAERLVDWWPSVYLDVRVTAPGDASGIGKHVELFTKGWLPYTLRWGFDVTENVPPRRIALRATGDFDGAGVWTIEPRAGGGVSVTYDWRIRADKPLLKYFSFAMKPLFSANHRWAMARGEESLRLEIARRTARTAEARARVPPPPPATWPHGRWRERHRAAVAD
jgi:hypothetical protein